VFDLVSRLRANRHSVAIRRQARLDEAGRAADWARILPVHCSSILGDGIASRVGPLTASGTALYRWMERHMNNSPAQSGVPICWVAPLHRLGAIRSPWVFTMTDIAELLSGGVSLSDLGCFCMLSTVALVLFSRAKCLL
jgi:hypothetical protein